MVVLGLDLGTSSIGWGLIDNKKNVILGAGVRIFPEGVENLGQGDKEISRNATRRGARGIRRQYFRRGFRKKLLRDKLTEYNMAPAADEWQEWLKLNPYHLRAEGLKRKLSLHELGRALYHMGQRRGFLSNSRSANLGDKSAIMKSSDGKIGITETREELAQHQTLGEYLHSILPKDGEKYRADLPRIRNRFTERSMYIDEFNQLWESQVSYGQELTDEMRLALGGVKKKGDDKDGILFYQRPLRSQKRLIGNCTFEPSKPRAPISCLEFEEFRLWQKINTIQCNNEFLSKEDRQKAYDYAIDKEKFTFAHLRKALNKSDNYFKFNYLDDDKFVGSHTHANLAKSSLFGKKWHQFSRQEQENIWHTLFFFDDIKKLNEYARTNWNFNEKQIDALGKFSLKKDYAGLSRKAIRNILPFLRDGYQYDQAVVLGGVKNAFGDKWQQMSDEDRKTVIDTAVSIISTQQADERKQSLESMLLAAGLPKNRLSKLYHHSQVEEFPTGFDRLPVSPDADRKIQDIRNPVVIAAIFELRKLVNAIIDKFGKPDEIRIELARDMKNSKEKRQQIRREQKQQEDKRDKVVNAMKKLISEGHRIDINNENILKYLLWEECQHKCPYSGREISVSDLFSGRVQIEHIFPYSRSLDDSFINKTLCYEDINRDKGDLTPFEYFSRKGGWDQVETRALKIFYKSHEWPNRHKKQRRFLAKSMPDGFIARQLNDTRYISKQAAQYLKQICNKVLINKGSTISRLRALWGLNPIIPRIENSNVRTNSQQVLDADKESNKNREDHRHHAIDAIIVAASTQRHLQTMTAFNRHKKDENYNNFPEPWAGFRTEVEDTVANILISFKQRRKVISSRYTYAQKRGKLYRNKSFAARSALHKETVYGKRQAPLETSAGYHVRKPIDALSSDTHIKKIVDPVIRSAAMARLEEMGVDTSKKFKIPPGAFVSKSEEGDLLYHLKIKNRKGEDVPVRKVRVREELGNAIQVRHFNGFADPQNNHHVIIYEDTDGNWKEQIVKFMEVSERKRSGQPIIQLPSDGKRIVYKFQENDMFLIGYPGELSEAQSMAELSPYLYRVQKLSSMYYVFRHHLASTIQHDEQMKRIVSFNALKEQRPLPISIDSLGFLSPK